MARGYGTTFGTGTGDDVALAFNSLSDTQRSYHIWTYRHAAAIAYRIWDAGPTLDLLWLTGTYNYWRDWSGGVGQWHTTTLPSVDAWHAIGLSYDASATTNDPLAYIDGASDVIIRDASPIGALTTTASAYHVGNRSGADRAWDGMLAEFAMWNVILTPAEFAALGKGVSAKKIRPDKLVCYVPMIRDVQDIKFGGVATLAGPPLVQPHIRQFYGRRQRGARKATGGGTNTPITAAAVAIGIITIVADITFTGLGPIATGAAKTLRGMGVGIAQIATGVAKRLSNIGKLASTTAIGSTNRILGVGKILKATAVGVAALTFGRAFFKTAAAVAVGVANMTMTTGHAIVAAAIAVGVAAMSLTTSIVVAAARSISVFAGSGFTWGHHRPKRKR